MKRSTLLTKQNTVEDVNEQNQMDIRRIEKIEKEDQSEETLELTSRWKELTKPGDYRMSNGVWKNYNPQQHQGQEIGRIEMELHQKKNRKIAEKMERQNQEPQCETHR